MALSSPLTVVSDYDDTLKVANIAGPRWDIVRRSVFSEAFYAGMPELFLAWDNSFFINEMNLYVLSGSPKQLRSKIEDDLYEEGVFPKLNLILRDWFRERDMFEYKLKKLHELPVGPLVMLGDDTQYDPEVYEAFSQVRSPLKIYIRTVTGRSAVGLQEKFVTAFDVAVEEFIQGRLGLDAVLDVGDAVLDSKEKELFPKFIPCELRTSSCLKKPLLEILHHFCSAIQQKIDTICMKRPQRFL